jgi:hypothetical protein
MDNLPTPVANPAPKSYISYPPEPIPDPEPFLSAKFVIFSVLVIGGAALGGLVQSGKISLKKDAVNQVVAVARTVAVKPAPAPAPVPTPKPDAFVVTSISLGQPSFAIINGVSHVEGDSLEAPGVSGWKVHQIVDGAVILQNGATTATIPETTPGLKPLNDDLHPLN